MTMTARLHCKLARARVSIHFLSDFLYIFIFYLFKKILGLDIIKSVFLIRLKDFHLLVLCLVMHIDPTMKARENMWYWTSQNFLMYPLFPRTLTKSEN